MAAQIGSIAKPKEIRFTDALLNTRSGKIMRRLLRNIASGEEHVGETTTLEDYSVLARLREAEEGQAGSPSPRSTRRRSPRGTLDVTLLLGPRENPA